MPTREVPRTGVADSLLWTGAGMALVLLVVAVVRRVWFARPLERQ